MAITLRTVKGSSLTYEEMDENFSYLETRVKDVSANIQSASYTLALTDRGKSIDTTAGVTIPLNSAVAFPVGSIVSITNTSTASITITATTNVTLHFAGTSATGNRTLALFGVATMRKIATDTWVISGAGLS